MFTRSYYSYFKIGRLSYHSTKISTSGFYNAMQLWEISTWSNWISDRKSWRYKGNLRQKKKLHSAAVTKLIGSFGQLKWFACFTSIFMQYLFSQLL